MINELTALFRLAGSKLLNIVLWPGDWLLAHLAELVPGVAETLALSSGNSPLLFAVSLLAWLILFFVLRGIVRFLHNTFRIFERIRRFARFRLSMALMFGRRRIDRLSDAFRMWGQTEEPETPHVVFEDRDVTVLDAIIARGPGFTLSAPELTEQLELRPSQVQRSMEKLHDSSLLQSVIGSTDGYDNYRVTPIGEAFMQSWLRQTAPGQIVRPKRRTIEIEENFIPDGLHLKG
jgi:DNA-binding MarR family transcriptional regulator